MTSQATEPSARSNYEFSIFNYVRPLGLRSLLLLCTILCVSLSSAQVTERSRMPRHPRLLLQRGQEKRLMRDVRKDSTWSDVHKGILGVADAYVQKATKPVEYVLTGRRLLGVSREALRRIIYRTTGANI